MITLQEFRWTRKLKSREELPQHILESIGEDSIAYIFEGGCYIEVMPGLSLHLHICTSEYDGTFDELTEILYNDWYIAEYYPIIEKEYQDANC